MDNFTGERTVEEGKELVDMRMRRLKEAYQQLNRGATRHTIIAMVMRVITIILAGFIGIRGVVEQQMQNLSQERIAQVVMIFTVIGFVITVLSTLEQAFKFEQRGAGLSELAQRAQSQISDFMRLANEPGKVTYKDYWDLTEKQDGDYKTLSNDALKFGARLKTTEDFSVITIR